MKIRGTAFCKKKKKKKIYIYIYKFNTLWKAQIHHHRFSRNGKRVWHRNLNTPVVGSNPKIRFFVLFFFFFLCVNLFMKVLLYDILYSYVSNIFHLTTWSNRNLIITTSFKKLYPYVICKKPFLITDSVNIFRAELCIGSVFINKMWS